MMPNKRKDINMPELPEVEHVKRGIEPYIKTKELKSNFSDNVIKGKKDNRETIIKGMELDSFAKAYRRLHNYSSVKT